MQIFRGKKSHGGRRTQGRRRREAQRRQSEAAQSLAHLVRREQRGSGTRRKTKRDHDSPGISLIHVGFLLTGLALGAGLLLSVSAVLKWHHTLDRADRVVQDTQAQSQAQAKAQPRPGGPHAATPTPAPAPGRPVVQATSPVECVRVMLQASYSGDRDTAYGQWDIQPSEMATLVAGQGIALSEMTAKAKAYGRAVRLSDFEFVLKSLEGDRATVAQQRGGTTVQVYSLQRHGPYWKIRFASRP